MVAEDEEKNCAKDCKKFVGCNKIPSAVWREPLSRRDKFWVWLAKKCGDYERA